MDRRALYGHEAADLLRVITQYKVLHKNQLLRLYPGKEPVVHNLLAHLRRQGRIYYNSAAQLYAVEKAGANQADAAMTAAVWVMLDFIDKVEYHTVGEYPVNLCFFTDGDMVEVVYVEDGREMLVSQILSALDKEPARRLIIVDNPEQIGQIKIPGTQGYCTVAPDGAVQYYQLREED